MFDLIFLSLMKPLIFIQLVILVYSEKIAKTHKMNYYQ